MTIADAHSPDKNNRMNGLGTITIGTSAHRTAELKKCLYQMEYGRLLAIFVPMTEKFTAHQIPT
nr:hypothetical protein [Cytophagales bacterium]